MKLLNVLGTRWFWKAKKAKRRSRIRVSYHDFVHDPIWRVKRGELMNSMPRSMPRTTEDIIHDEEADKLLEELLASRHNNV